MLWLLYTKLVMSILWCHAKAWTTVAHDSYRFMSFSTWMGTWCHCMAFVDYYRWFSLISQQPIY